MPEPITFYSTNHQAPDVDLAEALLQGQAPDRGLYRPRHYPRFSPAQLRELDGHSYARVAWEILRPFTSGVIDDARLRELCADAYDFEVPLEQAQPDRFLMRLDRGPTASFKDFAARMMARWMGLLVQRRQQPLLILTATSGDTGGAVAHAYRGLLGVRVVVLFPPDEVSERQRRQMTTIGGNVTAVGVAGKFDDCQALVKRAFADRDLADLRLTSANSINIGRLLPQAVYYVYAWINLAERAGERPITISVPSGNFGDMMGAVLAWKMGLPIARIVVATNANDEFPRFLQSGRYEKIAPSRVCISNAMNVGHPSNLARLVDVYGGWMDERGVVRRPPDLSAMRRDLYAVSIGDDETRATIRRAYEELGVLLEPHGAVGWAGLERFLLEQAGARGGVSVVVETAHPAKFPDELRALVGVDPPVPPALQGLEQRQESYERMGCEYGRFREWLRARFGDGG
jgi:threonine synthase